YDVVAEMSNTSLNSSTAASSSSNHVPNHSKHRSRSLHVDNRPATPVSVVARPLPSSSALPSKSRAGWIGHLIGTKQSKQNLEVKQTVLGL
ncbi:hypothetical protein FRB96_005934, partial [Tulasnella sp. 330]